MGKKTFILDTNVLLHDPNALEKFEGNNVVIPLVVLEELDKLKRYTDELGKNARNVIRFIDTLGSKGDLHKGVEVKSGGTFRVLMELRNGDKKNFPLAGESSRNKVLLATFHLQEKGEEAILITKDFVLRVKAGSIGINAQDYESLKESYDHLYKGLRRLTLPKAEIDRFFTEGVIKLDKEEFFPNEYCIMTCPEKSSITCKYNAKSKQLEPLISLKKDIWGIRPLNDEQRCAIDLLLRDDIKLITFIGQAGTGKTLLALTCGLKKIFDDDVYKKIVISRPIMPLGKDIGYLPGTKEEKIYHWMQPIYDNLEYLCEETNGNKNGEGTETKKWILDSEKIEMEAVTYIRGRSFTRTYIIIDEAQNLTPHEVKTIISRAGKGTKVILTGDPTQIDNPYLDKDSNALTYIVGKFKKQSIYGNIFFEKTERSELAALAADLL